MSNKNKQNEAKKTQIKAIDLYIYIYIINKFDFFQALTDDIQ